MHAVYELVNRIYIHSKLRQYTKVPLERGETREAVVVVVVFVTVVNSSFRLELCAALPTTHDSLHEIEESL
jgi:hypothetical protein